MCCETRMPPAVTVKVKAHELLKGWNTAENHERGYM